MTLIATRTYPVRETALENAVQFELLDAGGNPVHTAIAPTRELGLAALREFGFTLTEI